MEQKDPKDTTASELLRWAAENDKLRMRCDMCMKFYMMDSCGGHDCNDWLIDLADKIDAEIAEARMGDDNDTFMTILDRLITANSYPSRHEGEGFVGWVKRCWLPRPCDEDGEPVKFGDYDIDWDYTDECRVPGALLNATAVDCRGMLLATTFSNIIAVAKTDKRGRVKRPAPEVLLADGLPMREGETVWLTDEGARHAGESDTLAEAGPYALCGIGANDRLTVKALPSRFHPNRVDLMEEGAWCPASWLTHEEPDTQERIDEDAQKSTLEYWGCRDASCECCPAETDGKTPRGRFDARNCQQAQLLDLLRRQRELDARKGGE